MNRVVLATLVCICAALTAGCGHQAALQVGHTVAVTTQASDTAPPATAVAAETSRCQTKQLDVTVTSNGAAGSIRLTLTFTNTGRVRCFLYGYPGLGLLDSSGRLLPSQVLRTPSVVVPKIAERVVDLEPAGHAYAYAGFSDVDPQPCRQAAKLEVTPPDAYSHRLLAAQIAPCGGIIHVSPVFAAR